MKDLPQVIFNDHVVITSDQLSEFYGCTKKMISNNFNNNKNKYQKGKHFFALEGADKKEFTNRPDVKDGSSRAKILYLWTEMGAFLHAKSLNTETAWDVYEYLLDTYFKSREVIANNLPDFTNPAEMARAWAAQFEQAQLAESKVLELAPKAEYHDEVLTAENAMPISVIAKELEMSAIKLNRLLEAKGVQYKLNKQWLLSAKYEGKGYTDTYTTTYAGKDGSTYTSHQTNWTEKGRKFIHQLLKTQ